MHILRYTPHVLYPTVHYQKSRCHLYECRLRFLISTSSETQMGISLQGRRGRKQIHIERTDHIIGSLIILPPWLSFPHQDPGRWLPVIDKFVITRIAGGLGYPDLVTLSSRKPRQFVEPQFES